MSVDPNACVCIEQRDECPTRCLLRWAAQSNPVLRGAPKHSETTDSEDTR